MVARPSGGVAPASVLEVTLVLRLRPRLAALGFDRVYEVEEGGRLSLVVGNSKALWPAFRPVLDRSAADDPLDRYAREAIRSCLEPRDATEVVFAHDDPPPPIQAIAARAAGLAIAPCGMVIDDELGLWVALRAIIRTDDDPPEPPQRPSPCEGCDAPCRPALDAAMTTRPLSLEGVRLNWRAWLAVRDACPVGREHRYGEDQIAYHYRGERCSKK